MCFNVDAPPPRDLAQEGEDTLQAQIDLAPDIFAAESEFRPQYAQLDREIYADNLMGENGYLNLYENNIAPTMQRVTEATNRSQREADLADLQRLGPGVTEAILASNPEMKALMDELNRQAQAELALGGDLSEKESYDARQAIRTGARQRGQTFSNSTIYDEMMNDYALRDQKKRQSQQFATGMVGLNKAVTGDPLLAITGRPSQTPAMAGSLGAGGFQFQQGPSGQFDPFNSYAADLYNTNYNAEAAARINSANNLAGITGGIIGGASRIATGGLFG